MRKLLLVLLLITHAALAWSQEPEQTPRKSANTTLSLCGVRVLGGSNTAALLGLVGVAIDVTKEVRDAPYNDQLGIDMHRVFEETLAAQTAYNYVANANLVIAKDGQPLKLPEAARENQLSACIYAVPGMTVSVGWHKKVVLITRWDIVGYPDWKYRIQTKKTSSETHGTFPDQADPALKPVLLELAKESADEFSARLAELIVKPDFVKSVEAAEAIYGRRDPNARLMREPRPH